MRGTQSFQFYHRDHDEVIREQPKYTNIIFQAATSGDNFTMKAILISFEIQHPKSTTQMRAFIGNWQENVAVIVKMPNPEKCIHRRQQLKSMTRWVFNWAFVVRGQEHFDTLLVNSQAIR